MVLNINGTVESVLSNRDFTDLVRREMGDDAAEYFEAAVVSADSAKANAEQEAEEYRQSEERLLDHYTRQLTSIREELEGIVETIQGKSRLDKRKLAEALTLLIKEINAEL